MRQRPVAEIITDFDALRHPILRTLLESGPFGLAERARVQGMTLPTDFADRCHLCQSALWLLRDTYPEYLITRQAYREEIASDTQQ